MKISKLTKIQEKQIPKYIEKFVNIASQPTDRKKATKAVQALYKSAGKKKPIVIFGQSPFATAVMVAMCRILFKDKLVKDGSQLDSQLGSQLDSQLGSQLDSQLRSQLRSQLDSQLGSQLRSQLDSQLRSQLRSQLDSQLPKINNEWWLVVYWLIWAGWYAFGKYIGVKFDNKVLKVFMDFVSNVSFIIPYEGIAFVSETPKNISWENKRLSSLTGPAIEYADGYSLYCVNGVKVPEKIVKTPDKLTKKDWTEENNLEVRRVIQDIMPDFVEKIGAKEIQKDYFGSLMEIDLPNDPDNVARYVKVKDASTDRMYYLRVPPGSKTCKEGVGWTFGFEEEKYNPEIET